MNMIGGLIGGAIGGLIGAAIWVAIGFWTGYEVGWIAWGIGALVGIGVGVGTKQTGGPLGAVIAVVLSIAAIAGGKWSVVYLEVAEWVSGDERAISDLADVILAEYEEKGEPLGLSPDADDVETYQEMYPPNVWSEAAARWQAMSPNEQEDLRQYPVFANDDFHLVRIADGIVQQREEEGQQVVWPDGYDFDSAWREAHYPQDIWAQATAAWDAMSTAEQASYWESWKQEMSEGRALAEAQLTSYGFVQSFGLFDILWVVLAVGTAAKLGAGGARDESVPPEESQ
ncbi:MAG: hypothetical protein V3T53_15365 [Phycisphaerales bacterium]